MRLKLEYLVLFLVLVTLAAPKRSRGRSRGSSSGSSTFWTRKNKSSSSEPQKPVAKPSASVEPEIRKQSANVQQSAPVNRPIGWNVDNTGPKTMGQSNMQPQKQHINPSYSSGPGGYPNSPGGYSNNNPNYGGLNSNNPGGYPQGGLYSNYPGGQPSGGLYSNNPGGYSHGGPYSNNPGGYPQGGMYSNPGGYSHGGHPNPGAYPGGYYPNNGGHYPQMGYPQQPGLMGSYPGGNRHGFGGVGGLAGYGPYSYGLKKSGGFFGKHAFRNILGGLFVWYLVSGLMSTPYKVYNYYNQPKEEQAPITLPANVLMLCNENATSICLPGSTAICTQDSKILCVTTMTATSPCDDNNGKRCVNSTIPCLDTNDPLCQNKTSADSTTTVSLPCFTNMTLNGDQSALPPNVTLPASEDKTFCVTTMAVPDPDLPVEKVKPEGEEKNTTDISQAENHWGWDPNNLTSMGYYGRYSNNYSLVK